MNAALRDLLQRAVGAGELAGDDVLVGRAEHPVCGDRVEITLRIEHDGAIADYAWRAEGCPATLAVAAAAHEAFVGGPADGALGRLRARLTGLGGLAAHEHHAEAMLTRAFEQARRDSGAGR